MTRRLIVVEIETADEACGGCSLREGVGRCAAFDEPIVRGQRVSACVLAEMERPRDTLPCPPPDVSFDARPLAL